MTNVLLWSCVLSAPLLPQVSSYHYRRQEARWDSTTPRPPTLWFDKSLDACVMEGDPECQVCKGLMLE